MTITSACGPAASSIEDRPALPAALSVDGSPVPASSTRGLIDRPGHRWRVLGIGVAANACFSAMLAGIPTTGVLMRQDYHLSTGQLGLALSMLGLGVAVSELPWGLLTDRWGDRRVLLTGLGLTAAAFVLMSCFLVPTLATIPSLALLAAALLLAGLLGGSVNGSSGRAVMAWFKEGERGLAMSIRQTAVPMGGGIGAMLLPPLAAHLGFLAVYAMLALLCAVTTAIAWFWLHEPPATIGATPLTAPTPQLSPLRDLQVWRIALGIGVLCLPQIAVLSFATIFLHDVMGAGIALTSMVLILVQAGAAVTRIWSGRYTDRRRNRRPYMRFCALLTTALFLILGLAIGLLPGLVPPIVALPIVIALLIAGGIAASAWHGVAFTELAGIAGTKRVGTALALGNTCAFAAFFLAPLGIPLLLPLISWPGIWLVASLAALIAWPLFPGAKETSTAKKSTT